MPNAVKKILLFEDDRFIRAAYIDALERAGFLVRVRENGDDCLAIVDDFAPNIVLLDLMMPGRDGFVVLADFAAHRIASQIPVLVLTNLSQMYYKDEILRLGATDYYEKVDMTAKELVELVKKYLR